MTMTLKKIFSRKLNRLAFFQKLLLLQVYLILAGLFIFNVPGHPLFKAAYLAFDCFVVAYLFSISIQRMNDINRDFIYVIGYLILIVLALDFCITLMAGVTSILTFQAAPLLAPSSTHPVFIFFHILTCIIPYATVISMIDPMRTLISLTALPLFQLLLYFFPGKK